MRHEADAAARQGHHIVIEPLQREAVQIGEIAGDVELGDLALPVLQILVAGQQALDQQGAHAQVLAGADERAVGRQLDHLGDRIPDRLLLRGRQVVAGPELHDVRVDQAIHPSSRATNGVGPATFRRSRRVSPAPGRCGRGEDRCR
jgi:hypothetical protein